MASSSEICPQGQAQTRRETGVAPASFRTMLYLHCLKVSVTAGSFVMYRITDETSPQIGRVIDVVLSMDSVPQDDTQYISEELPQASSSKCNQTKMPFQFVKVNHFKYLSSFDISKADALASTSDDGWQNVVQVDEQYWISSVSICNLSFVFTDEEIQSGVFDDCRGMYNFFVLKHHVSQDGCIVTVPRHACPPFPECMDGFSEFWCMDHCKLIFNSIRQIRQDIQRILCRVVQSQGDFATNKVKLQLPSCSWFFIKNAMALQGIESISSIKYSQPRTILSWGLCYHSHRYTGSLDVLRFDTQAKLAAFRELFGKSCGYGVRKKRPKYSEGRSLLSFNDVINVIACTSSTSTDEQQETENLDNGSANWRSFQRIAGRMHDGIDLAYDADKGILQVVLRYHKMVVIRDESTFTSLKCIGVASPETLGTVGRNLSDLTFAIIPGMEFMDKSFVMRVVSATDQEIHARKVYQVLRNLTTVRALDSRIVIYTDLAYVNNQIQEMLK